MLMYSSGKKENWLVLICRIELMQRNFVPVDLSEAIYNTDGLTVRVPQKVEKWQNTSFFIGKVGKLLYGKFFKYVECGAIIYINP